MLENLEDLPTNAGRIRELLTTQTGYIVHEIGHVVKTASVNIPTDYLIIEEQPGGTQHATYTHSRYAKQLESSKINQIEILAGGFLAERAIFGQVCPFTATADLEKLAQLMGRTFERSEDKLRKQIRDIEKTYTFAFSNDQINLIRELYIKVSAAIRSGKYLKDGAQIIPFKVLDSLRINLLYQDRALARIRTCFNLNRNSILKDLRSGVSSGL